MTLKYLAEDTGNSRVGKNEKFESFCLSWKKPCEVEENRAKLKCFAAVEKFK